MSLSFDMDGYFRAIRFFIKCHWLALLVSSVLVVIPFFWFKPGEIDIGGDGGRLYFYDPVNLIKNSVYVVLPFGVGNILARFFYIPLYSILAILMGITHSSYVLAAFYSGMKITVGFLAVYGIVKVLLGNKLKDKSNQIAVSASSLLAALFYVFNPAMTENYVRALPSHDQVFLNPLMFYLLLKYLTTSQFRFLSLALFASLIFSHSFSFTAAPPFFAFYPLGILFLIIYNVFILKRKIPWKGLAFGLLLFLGLHAFHLLPEYLDLFSAGTYTNTRVFNKTDILEQISYFSGVLGIPKLSIRWFANSVYSQISWASIIVPLVIILGLIFNKKAEKTVLLLGFFFLITFYFVNAKITDVGVELYRSLFYIPGFSMFRNFYGQWQFVYYFFYPLFFGVTVFYLFYRLSHKLMIVFSSIIVLYFVVSSWQFINGQLVNQLNNQSTTRVGIVLDPRYESVLDYIRSLPSDGKILLLPSSDYDYQVVHGLNNGAFVGRSMIGQLTGKKDFAGFMDLAPYSDTFWELSKAENYDGLQRLMGLLNIRYVFYNSDPNIYDDLFPSFPYDYVRKNLPANQTDYQRYVNKLSLTQLYKEGPYTVYQTGDDYYLPLFYTATNIHTYQDVPKLSEYAKAKSFFPIQATDVRTAFMEQKDCMSMGADICNALTEKAKQTPKIYFRQINPTKYRIVVSGAQNPYVLVFSNSFHTNWNVYIDTIHTDPPAPDFSYFNGDIREGNHTSQFISRTIFETQSMVKSSTTMHFSVNGYANAWYITPEYAGYRENYELVVEMENQKIFLLGLGVSFITLLLILSGFILGKTVVFNKKIVRR